MKVTPRFVLAANLSLEGVLAAIRDGLSGVLVLRVLCQLAGQYAIDLSVGSSPAEFRYWS